MLPWPTCPLAGHARFGQNIVVGAMRILLSWRCWGACQEGVCLDPHFCYKGTSPRFSGELPSYSAGTFLLSIINKLLGVIRSFTTYHCPSTFSYLTLIEASLIHFCISSNESDGGISAPLGK